MVLPLSKKAILLMVILFISSTISIQIRIKSSLKMKIDQSNLPEFAKKVIISLATFLSALERETEENEESFKSLYDFIKSFTVLGPNQQFKDYLIEALELYSYNQNTKDEFVIFLCNVINYILENYKHEKIVCDNIYTAWALDCGCTDHPPGYVDPAEEEGRN